jgi:hypothetical protein
MREPFVAEFMSGTLIYGVAGTRDGDTYHVERGAYIGTNPGTASTREPGHWNTRNYLFSFSASARLYPDPSGWLQHSHNACLKHWWGTSVVHG